MMRQSISERHFYKDKQYYKFCFYGFFKNLRLFDPFLLLYFVDEGISYSQIGILYAFREVIINLFEIISGVIADVVGRKNAMIAAFVSYIVSFLLFYSFSGFTGFLLAFFFYGIGDSFRTGTHKAMINAYLLRNNWQDEKVRYYGRTRSWSQRGSAISSLLSAFLLFYTGRYDFLFLLTAVPYVFDLVLLSSYPSYLNGAKGMSKSGLWLKVKAHFIEVVVAMKKLSSVRVVILTSSFTGYYKAVKDYIQIIITGLAAKFIIIPHVNNEQHIAIYIGLTYFALFMLNSVASRNAYKIEQMSATLRIGLINLQRSGYLLGVVASLFFVFDYPLVALLAFASIFIVQNLRRPLAVNYITKQFDEKMMASIMSVESQSETLISALLALLLGILVDLSGVGWGIGVLSVLLLVLSVFAGTFKVKN
ncbi:MFS transporter [Carboxylicivirga sediminis]|uniref:MFS transporter n=1 Tax=Carboxylicivirga sediminis TaxID=2006564 RepID=A0A941F6A1_9BACT|nr:MFS transporter [Carboxylicivirga sediminis]MBR8537626.1 MFS transporter [Carboxylicivirga sediminis]